ncbi:hypothetical protein OU994_14575 [Pseudoduganella sp. SL102]|uniref:hypothetical protein n=1 Tax=Pseudoduganella sp. SL102 TaxID=2995154 RepID=UPI00248CFF31|nr:hypothetical protein [Pseudoduganella sp. SL102]WBS05411.1 hypothetical protein OU994_14575 [Pseudoduganella sp. SL102]
MIREERRVPVARQADNARDLPPDDHPGHRRSTAHFVRPNDSFLDKHGIKHDIDKVYAFDEAEQAYEHLAPGPFGKVVIKVADQSRPLACQK